MSRPLFGPAQQTLGHPATTRFLDSFRDEDANIEARNNAIVLAATRETLQSEARTEFVIRHRTTRLYFHGRASLGDIWGGLSLAKRYDSMAMATCAAMFECREPDGAWDVVAVEGAGHGC